MLNKTLSLLLVFSLAFNIAFVGMWVYNRSTRVPPQAAAAGPSADAGPTPLPAPPSWQQLSLRGPQERQISQAWREVQQKVEAINAETHQQREKLVELLAADKLDQEAIAACQKRIEANQQAARQLVLEQMVKTRDALTPEQRANWMRMMKAAGQRYARRRRPLGLRPNAPEGPRHEPPASPAAPPKETSQRQNPRGSSRLTVLCLEVWR